MGWAKFDDGYGTHPKLVGDLEARGLDAAAICQCARDETDGFLSDTMLLVITAGVSKPHKIAQRLVARRRWRRDDERGGYWVHDYLDYNPSHEESEAKREADRARKESGRKRQGRAPDGKVTSLRNPSGIRAESERNPDGIRKESAKSPQNVTPVPTRPVVNRSLSSHHGVAPAPAENDPLKVLGHRLSELWPARRRLHGQAYEVVRRCLLVADPSIVDECIGIMLTVDDKPNSPNYLLKTVRNRLVSMGAYAPGDPALEPLGAA